MSRNRDEELLEEIKELERTEGAELDEEGKPDPEPKTVSAEDETWRKRYGDLRSHAQKQEDALKARVKELEERVANDKKAAPPKTQEEVLAWREKYPDLFDTFRTIILGELEETKTKYDERFQELDAREYEMARKKAYSEVVKAHSDFPELINDEDFQNWLDDPKTPAWAIHALRENDTDSSIAIDAVDFYKLKTTKKTRKEPDPDTRDAALGVKTSSKASVPSGQNEWSESKVEKLNNRDYAKYAEEIDAAMAAGKFTYDISGAAR
jgi:hypothetical protein